MIKKSCNNSCKESWCCSHWVESWKIYDDLHFGSIDQYDRWLDEIRDKASCALTRGAKIYLHETEILVVWNLKCQNQLPDGKCAIHDCKPEYCAEFPKKHKNHVVSENCKYTGKFIVVKSLKEIKSVKELENSLR